MALRGRQDQGAHGPSVNVAMASCSGTAVGAAGWPKRTSLDSAGTNGFAMTREKEALRAQARSKTGPQADAAGQYGDADGSPNPSGVASANPTVLSGDGDATSGSGHGRDRDGRHDANRKSDETRGQRADDLPFSGTPGSKLST